MIPLAITAAILYGLAGAWLLRRLRHPGAAASGFLPLWPAVVALLIHGPLVWKGLFTPEGLNVELFAILGLVGWLVALLLTLASLSLPVASLGIVVYPVVALSVIGLAFAPPGHYLTEELDFGLRAHILLSILAYSLLSIAAVQAALLYIQDSHLHRQQPGGFVRALPPLETMEKLLFGMIGLGFGLLTLSLLSGAFYLNDIFGQHLVHKTVLSVIAWLIFAVLLFGRWQFGWRGRVAIRWAISGFVVLMLAYFGSKFVIELLLGSD